MVAEAEPFESPEEIAAIFVTVGAIICLWIWIRNGQPTRFRLRTLLIALAVLPPAVAAIWWLYAKEGVLGVLMIGACSVGVAFWVQLAIKRTMGW